MISRRYVTRAREGTQRLQSILSALGAAARVEESIKQAERVNFDLRDLLTSAVAAYRDGFPQAHIALETPADPCFFRGAPDLLVQLLDKLIENAVDFCPAGGTITVRLERAQSNYRAASAERRAADSASAAWAPVRIAVRAAPGPRRQAAFRLRAVHRAAGRRISRRHGRGRQSSGRQRRDIHRHAAVDLAVSRHAATPPRPCELVEVAGSRKRPVRDHPAANSKPRLIAPSWLSSHCLRSRPPPYPVKDPSAPITR